MVYNMEAARLIPEKQDSSPCLPFPFCDDNPLMEGFLMLTQERLKELLHYEPETGVFTWRQHRGCSRVGGVAGDVKQDGYRHIGIDKRRYQAHRVVWLYVHGYFPEHQIDHINRVPDDNRLVNLREVTTSCNVRNTGNAKDNKSGVKGVCWNTKNKRWVVTIRRINIGGFSDFTEAVCHRLAAEECLDWPNCDTDSPAHKYVKKHIRGELI
jgi:hypothetical protein